MRHGEAIVSPHYPPRCVRLIPGIPGDCNQWLWQKKAGPGCAAYSSRNQCLSGFTRFAIDKKNVLREHHLVARLGHRCTPCVRPPSATGIFIHGFGGLGAYRHLQPRPPHARIAIIGVHRHKPSQVFRMQHPGIDHLAAMRVDDLNRLAFIEARRSSTTCRDGEHVALIGRGWMWSQCD